MPARMPLLLATLALHPGVATSQLEPERFDVFPTAPGVGDPFLVLVEDHWTDGCGGEVALEVTSSTIDVTATLASPRLGAICTQVTVPFTKLLNPRAVAPDIDFADTVTVRYFFDAGNGPDERASRALSFDDQPGLPTTVETGSWVSASIESSGLFLDQQGDVLTALVADYGEDGVATWHYAAGKVHGNVFSAPAQQFSEIVCVTEPCDRAAPANEGRIDLLLENPFEIVVTFDGVLLSGRVDESDAWRYQRLDFEPLSATDGLDPELPDLVGRWVAGVRGLVSYFQEVEIILAAVDEDGRVPEYRFDARSIGTGDPLGFVIRCADERPIGGPTGCGIDLAVGNWLRCGGGFPYDAVRRGRLTVRASCDNNATLESRIELFQLN